MPPVKVLEVVCEGDDVMDGHLGLHDVDLLLARGRQQVDLLHPRLVNTVKEGYRRIYESNCRQNCPAFYEMTLLVFLAALTYGINVWANKW